MDNVEKLPYVGYVIDLGVIFNDKQKAVHFKDGVGVLDYEAVAAERHEWFEYDATGKIVGVKPNSVSMQAFVDYWENRGAKVTEISETESKHIKRALAAGNQIDPKYFKVPVDAREIVTGKKKPAKGETKTSKGPAWMKRAPGKPKEK